MLVIHPFDPTEPEREREDAPDLGDVADRILNGGDGPTSAASR